MNVGILTLDMVTIVMVYLMYMMHTTFRDQVITNHKAKVQAVGSGI